MDHLLHDNDSDFPLIQQLLSVPRYKRMYLAHFKTIMLENFDNNSYFQTGQELQDLIAGDVQADQNKFYSDFNFDQNIYNVVSDLIEYPGIREPGIWVRKCLTRLFCFLFNV